MHNIFLSLSRLMVVIYPIDTIFKKVRFAQRILIFIFTSSFILSILFTIVLKIMHDTHVISLCFPFVDPSKTVLLIKFIVWFVALSEVISSVIIIILQSQMVIIVRKSENVAQMANSKASSGNFLIVQLVILTISIILCWYPANTIYIAVMLLSTYSTDLIIWTIVLIFPLNSIVNPCIFIISAIRKSINCQRSI